MTGESRRFRLRFDLLVSRHRSLPALVSDSVSFAAGCVSLNMVEKDPVLKDMCGKFVRLTSTAGQNVLLMLLEYILVGVMI
jgi:hypothetical protein